jgi:hypothetical protein
LIGTILGVLGATALVLCYLAVAEKNRDIAQTQFTIMRCASHFAELGAEPGTEYWIRFARRHEYLAGIHERRAWPYRLHDYLGEGKRHVNSRET